MSQALVVTGTGTGIGKSVFAAGLCGLLSASYWKPVQSGIEDETDTQLVARLGRLDARRLIPERYRLTLPLSPHRAAELDDVTIALDALALPQVTGPLVVEGAGGAMVPLDRSHVFADLFARWQAPVIIVATTALGTISHSLSAIESLKRRSVPILGIAFVGDANEDNEHTIPEMAGVRRLGRLPRLDPLTPQTLADAFAIGFRLQDFA